MTQLSADTLILETGGTLSLDGDLSAGSRHGGLAHIGTDITGFGVRYTLELLASGWPGGRAAGARA